MGWLMTVLKALLWDMHTTKWTFTALPGVLMTMAKQLKARAV
jgi:hypothetical protein